jgi:hypothetical protein
MQATVTHVFNKFGPAFKIEGDTTVYNPDKFKKPSFDGLQPGCVIEFEADGKWVKELTIVNGGTPGKPTPAPAKTYPANNQETQDRIARGNACNAVFGSPAIAEIVKDKGHEEAVAYMIEVAKHVAKFISTGE